VNDRTFNLFPPGASTVAPRVDWLFFFELAVATFFCALIFGLIIHFCIRYQRKHDREIPPKIPGGGLLEWTWTIVPFLIMLVFFFWGADVYTYMKRPPTNALVIHVIGKQWMWEIEHSEGVRENDELHVPIGQPIKLVLASQDVIHDFFIPAFRIKQDVVPGSFSTEWFTATVPGTYHLFCAQYCGMGHSLMVGKVIVMRPEDYQAWLAGAMPNESPAAVGAQLFSTYGCAACHGQRGPTMAGLYGSTVQVLDQADGKIKTVTADEDYIRESITYPDAKIVTGYAPLMPSYRNQLSEEQLFDLIEYIKSLAATNAPGLEQSQSATSAHTNTVPANGFPPTRAPDYPPARQPPKIPNGESNP
jgi:cytochrome c oxidase subunit 2